MNNFQPETSTDAAPGALAAPLWQVLQQRRSLRLRRLLAPGPDAQQRAWLLQAAACAPDHGGVLPWRLVEVSAAARPRLAQAFLAALLARDPRAEPAARERAYDKAFHAPWLLLAVLRCANPEQPADAAIPDAERLIAAGAALQNMLLLATALGLGSGLSSGQSLQAEPLRQLFALQAHEQALCFVGFGQPSGPPRAARAEPDLGRYFSRLE